MKLCRRKLGDRGWASNYSRKAFVITISRRMRLLNRSRVSAINSSWLSATYILSHARALPVPRTRSYLLRDILSHGHRRNGQNQSCRVGFTTDPWVGRNQIVYSDIPSNWHVADMLITFVAENTPNQDACDFSGSHAICRVMLSSSYLHQTSPLLSTPPRRKIVLIGPSAGMPPIWFA